MGKVTLRSVREGAEHLDRIRPGWAAKINVQTLDLRDPRECILGQVFGNYNAGVQAIFPKGYFVGVDYPFTGVHPWYPESNLPAWLDEIAARTPGGNGGA